eukprot:gene9949-11001_t
MVATTSSSDDDDIEDIIEIVEINESKVCEDDDIVIVEEKQQEENLSIELKTSVYNNLVQWYDSNRRQLPWRGDPPRCRPIDPYGVWISEVMCQQTRVETVIDYWNRWMDVFPNTTSLATASVDEVNKQWAGLGYYRRAQNLRLGAQYVIENFHGMIPNEKVDLLRIPGIGPYTAGAIASIAFQQKEAAVDGNVYRVFSRLFAFSHELGSKSLEKECWKYDEAIVAIGDRPGDYNQAVMELGATVCKPLNPQCSICPIQMHCKAHQRYPGRETMFPVKAAKKAAPREVRLAVHVLRTECDGKERFLLLRRPAKGLLANQWEFPSLEGDEIQRIELRREISRRGRLRWLDDGNDDNGVESSSENQTRITLYSEKVATINDPLIHIFSHEKHTMHLMVEDVKFLCDDLERECCISSIQGVKWMTAEEMEEAGITTGCKKVLRAVQTMGQDQKTSKKRRVIEKKEELADLIDSKDAFAVMKASATKQRKSETTSRQSKGKKT